MPPEVDFAEWRGGVNQRLRDHDEKIADLEANERATSKTLTRIEVSLASVKTTVGVWSAIGGVVGAGIIGLLTNGHL